MAQKDTVEALKNITEKLEQLLIAQVKDRADHEHIKETLGQIKVDISTHIKRTDILEHEFTKIRGFLFYFTVTVATLGSATTILSVIWKAFH